MSELLDITEFRRLARRGTIGERGGVAARRARALGPLDGRVVRFLFSDGSVDRAGDRIDPQGWETAAYKKNPVVLWAHDSFAPPIGRTINLFVDARGLVGDVEFAEPEVYPFADQIFRLVGAGFIKAGSVGFLPIEYSFSKDKGREFGIDFRSQELLEFSVVPVPANANALVEAQAKRVISAGEADILRRRLAVDPDRLRRIAELAPRAKSAARSAGYKPPSRAVLLHRVAGPWIERDRQVDREYPELARQELRAALSKANTETEAGRLAIIEAWGTYIFRRSQSDA